jgi:predicted small secreted protein
VSKRGAARASLSVQRHGRGTSARGGHLPAIGSGASFPLRGNFGRCQMKKLLVLAALTSGLVLSACNTVRGAANDVASTTDCVDGVDNNC